MLFFKNAKKHTFGNFSDTPHVKFQELKGSIGHWLHFCICTGNQNQRSIYPFIQHDISILIELILGHLCYFLTDVLPQPNSLLDIVSCVTHEIKLALPYVHNEIIYSLLCSVAH